MGRNPKPGNEHVALAVAARAHLRRAEALGKSLDQRMKVKKSVSDEWTLDDDYRRDFAMITQTIRDCGAALQKALEGNKKQLGGLTEQQLEMQFQAEIIKAAAQISDEDWQRMCEARAKAKQG